MKLVKGIDSLQRKLTKPVLTMGIFDGLHLAHQKIIRQVVRQAKLIQGTSVVLTFSPHPLKINHRFIAPPLIVTFRQRIDLIAQLNVDVCIILDFNKKFSQLSAQEFVQQVLVEGIGVRAVVVGAGFRFGKDRKGSFAVLKRMAKKYNFAVQQCPALKTNSHTLSSTLVRRCVRKGKLAQANKLLGRRFSIFGLVKKGSARGRILGYPTANIESEQELLPARGVYAVLIIVNKVTFSGILNIGFRPTFATGKKSTCTIEAHIFNFDRNIYGEKIEVQFLRKIRDEKRFASKQALLTQVRKDEIIAQRSCKKYPSSLKNKTLALSYHM